MPNIQLATGKTIYVSSYEYYFGIDDENAESFFQSCIADDLGSFVENPFNNSPVISGRLEIEVIEGTIEDIPEADI
jgi:hypothetical protein